MWKCISIGGGGTVAGASLSHVGKQVPLRQDTSHARLLFDKIEVIGNLHLPPTMHARNLALVAEWRKNSGENRAEGAKWMQRCPGSYRTFDKTDVSM